MENERHTSIFQCENLIGAWANKEAAYSKLILLFFFWRCLIEANNRILRYLRINDLAAEREFQFYWRQFFLNFYFIWMVWDEVRFMVLMMAVWRIYGGDFIDACRFDIIRLFFDFLSSGELLTGRGIFNLQKSHLSLYF